MLSELRVGWDGQDPHRLALYRLAEDYESVVGQEVALDDSPGDWVYELHFHPDGELLSALRVPSSSSCVVVVVSATVAAAESGRKQQ